MHHGVINRIAIVVGESAHRLPTRRRFRRQEFAMVPAARPALDQRQRAVNRGKHGKRRIRARLRAFAASPVSRDAGSPTVSVS